MDIEVKKRARLRSRAFSFWGSMSNETLLNELNYPVHLDNRHRGQLAELAFMRKAASLGFAVAKPWQEGERYDVIVRVETTLWRVQVKSVLAKSSSRPHYRVKTSGGGSHRKHTFYSPEEIDFLVAYIFQEDLWYVFPATVIENRNSVCITPGSKRSKFDQYREAWNLMRRSAIVPEDHAAAAAGT
jgi:hypothetical protein